LGLSCIGSMDDPSQSAAGAASRQDHAAQEKFRAQMQQGSLTGLLERNTKFDVEYEGKDAVGTLVRPFEPGFGDSRRLPEKMLGESTRQAVARSMGRDMPHSGMGDGTKVFKTADDPAKLRRMLKEEQEKDAPPPLPRLAKNIKVQAEQQSRLEQQWAVGLTGGSYGMHTRHFVTPPPAYASESQAKKGHPTPWHGTSPDKGPPSPSRSPSKMIKDTSVMKNGAFNPETTYSRASPFAHKREYKAIEMASAGYGKFAYFDPQDTGLVPRSRDKPLRNEGAHAMLDRMGPNILSGPIPRDGFTTDAYEELTRDRLHEMGFSDILGETGERPDEIAAGTDHLDQLELLGKSAKDLQFSAGFTGNEGLYKAKMKV